MTGPSRDFDFDSAPRPVGALDAMLPSLTDRLAAAVGALFRTDVHIRLTDYQAISRGDFLASAAEGCRMRLIAPSAILDLAVAPETAFGIVDWLLGGSPGDAPAPNRPLTSIEQRLLRRFAGSVAQALSQAWQNGDDSVFEVHAAVDSPAEPEPAPAMAATLALSAGSWQGTLKLCLPESSSPPTLPDGAATAPEAVDVSVEVDGPAVTTDELAGLECDDVVLTDTPTGGEVIVRVGGEAKFAARLGVIGGKRAITITRRLDDGKQ